MNTAIEIEPPSLADIRAAATRIAGWVRRTPMIRAAPARRPAADGMALWLKLESLQISGSFKARGASNRVAALDPSSRARGLVTASGGNHGLGVAYAGWRAGAPTRVYLAANTPPRKADQLRAWGAEVVIEGAVWDDANRVAQRDAERTGRCYIHPFADPLVIAGQGSLGLEILDDLPALDSVLVAIGGGGLISGVALAIKALRPQTRVIGIEPVGAPTLHASVAAGHLVTLETIDTAANTLAPRRSAQINLGIISRLVDEILLVEDEEMREAARWLWREFGIGAELSAAAPIAALLTGKFRPEPGTEICALVCGAGADGADWTPPPAARYQ
ncbi:MAG: threonine/serine dehydratase [Alphaproteobacteria bacterium]|jgi:threonine dehydratase|nr:threonine/serine dehydratase [Alphaproteobacteria bacterium]MDP6518133.1 threonine/serine dehydratase [Alphaproteobacteria bacterium]